MSLYVLKCSSFRIVASFYPLYNIITNMGLEQEDNTDSPRTERCCQTCKQPVKGHKGQPGKYCINITNSGDTSTSETVKNDESANEQSTETTAAENKTPGQDNTQVTGLLTQLVQQMVSVNTNIQGVLEGQNRIITMLGNANTGGNPSVSSNSTTVVQQNNGVPQQTLLAASQVQVEASVTNTTSGPAQSVPLPVRHAVPFVSEKVQKSALLGEFINLSDFLPHNDVIQSEQNDDTDMCCNSNKKSKPKKIIDRFDTWLTAWSCYEALLVGAKPELFPGMLAHQQLIQKCSHKYNWHAVYTYDMRFRANLATTKSFAFQTVDTELFVTILDSTAVKQNAQRCFRCKSFEHGVGECPFPAEHSLAKEAKTAKSFTSTKQGNTFEKFYHNGQEICINFQQGRCSFAQCKRAHVCKGCRSNEPQSKCSTCNRSQTSA